MSPPAQPRPAPDVSARLAALEARLDSLEHAQVQTSQDAREARDSSKEILIILREQNALERVAEARAEARKGVSDLREDVVNANTLLRNEHKSLTHRVEALEAVKTKGQGVLMGGKWIIDGLKVIAAAGGGAIILKLLEAWK